MEKAIIFGIGKNWDDYKNCILKYYEIVGYVDNNYENLCSKYGMNIQAVNKIFEYQYDVIVIMPNNYFEMYKQLIEMGVSRDKIVIFRKSSKLHEKIMFGVKSYAQHYEDLVIAGIFGHLGIKNPTYIDLGANDPTYNSNTALLYYGGCRGINVEPNEDMISRFTKERPLDINLNLGVANSSGSLTFYKYSDENSAMNTFSKEDVQTNFQRGLYVEESVNVSVKTLQEIIDQYCDGIFPDFLDCDIEGFDYEVLKSFDLKNNGPVVICVEVKGSEILLFDDLMIDKCYFRFCRIGQNSIYVKNEFAAQLMYVNLFD